MPVEGETVPLISRDDTLKTVSEVVWQRWLRNDGIGWTFCVINNEQVRKVPSDMHEILLFFLELLPLEGKAKPETKSASMISRGQTLSNESGCLAKGSCIFHILQTSATPSSVIYNLPRAQGRVVSRVIQASLAGAREDFINALILKPTRLEETAEENPSQGSTDMSRLHCPSCIKALADSRDSWSLSLLRSLWKPLPWQINKSTPLNPPPHLSDSELSLLLLFDTSFSIITGQYDPDMEAEWCGSSLVDCYKLQIPGAPPCRIEIPRISNPQPPRPTLRFECAVIGRELTHKSRGEYPGLEKSVLRLIVIRTDEYGISERTNAHVITQEYSIPGTI